MKNIALILLLVCVALKSVAQANFVKNSSFEDIVYCPDDIDKLSYSKYWNAPVDTIGVHSFDPEYYNSCAGISFPIRCGVPENTGGYQYPHSGNAYIGSHLYYDKSAPPPPFVSPNWRDYAQGHLNKPLQNGKTYCVSFWVVMAETSGYAHNSIGAYLDNGAINMRSPAGEMITDVIPQVYSTSIIKDTMNWVKVEGNFVANGTETHITLGNFAKQADVDTDFIYWGGLIQYSYYLIDDVSVIPIDLPADAGKDTWVEQGKKVQIGRVGDTTAQGLDCKWYKMGVLIDSGAIITVNANSIINAVDAYVVAQNICGIIKRDTVNVKTTSVGIKEYKIDNQLSLYPNPSDGAITIKQSTINDKQVKVKVYNAIGSLVYQSEATFVNGQMNVKLGQKAQGVYLVCIGDDKERTTCLRFIIN